MQTPAYLFSLSTHSDVTSIKSLDVTFLQADINFSQYDYLIITSKQAVEALSQYKMQLYISKKALAISKKSAQAYKDIGGEILQVGEGYGSDLYEKISTYPKKTKWLYLRAKVVASDFVEKSKLEGYSIDEAVVYETFCSQDITCVEIEKNATLIFTSPSSVECYLQNHTITEEQKVIVIGKTTAKSLPKNIRYTISKKTDIESCIDLLK